MTILKHSKDEYAKEVIKQMKNNVYILNVITCGKIRNGEEKIDKIKERLADKFNNMNEPLNKKRKLDNPCKQNNTLNQIMDLNPMNKLKSGKYIQFG